MLDRLSDEQLMSAYANSNDINHHRAFEVLYERHKGPLYRFMKTRINNDQDLNELFQELWVRIINHKDRFDPKKRFKTWAYTIAKRLMIDHFRQTGQNPNQLDLDDEISDATIQEPADQAQWQAMGQQFMASLNALPAEQQEAFVLHHDGGFSLKEVAAITDRPHERIKSQYRYAIGKLRKALERFK